MLVSTSRDHISRVLKHFQLDLFSSSFLNFLSTARNSDGQCEQFLANYSLAVSLTLVASLCTVILNFLLKAFMKLLAQKEFHVTSAENQRAIVVKVFITTYINMAFVALLAYGYVRNKPAMAKTVSRLSNIWIVF